MGVRYLNKLFRETCKNSDAIKIINMNQLHGKKIAVDISIYLYKFVSENSLIESTYSMLSIFRYYNIIPIFVFDGRPPTEKKELLEQRLAEKKVAENEFNILKQKLEYDSTMDEDEKHEITNKMDLLKKKFIYINKKQICAVKNLITNYGMTYCEAPNEADELCAMFVLKGTVWGCLSEDMDMFLYGCPRVLRYLSLMNHTFVLYDTKKILNNLEMNQNELREISVISGTDYNFKNQNKQSLFTTLKYFKKYKKNVTKNDSIPFYNWLQENTSYIEGYDYETYKMDNSMFILNNIILDSWYGNISISNKNIMHSEIKEILKTEGFVFPLLP